MTISQFFKTGMVAHGLPLTYIEMSHFFCGLASGFKLTVHWLVQGLQDLVAAPIKRKSAFFAVEHLGVATVTPAISRANRFKTQKGGVAVQGAVLDFLEGTEQARVFLVSADHCPVLVGMADFRQDRYQCIAR